MDDITELMIKEANRALQYSYAPYSNYAVAACVCSEDERLFTGVNVENSSYGLTICAETSAICQMISAGLRTIKSIVLMAGDNMLCVPCGACRQRISEFSTATTRIHLCDKKHVLETISISELLPMAFAFKKN